mmetsp:Transcript_30398/g.34648  ORF Transcript_30398/g.34648 Transcript_30398/m.34648 type:complete len:91 (+) Transcript_30398:49-321(+)
MWIFGKKKKNSNNKDEKEDSSSSNPICIDCDKKNQKDLPSSNKPSAATGQPCDQLYQNVAKCMIENDGQITSCVEEWKLFNKCHEKNKIN